jgi:hypothetical protein
LTPATGSTLGFRQQPQSNPYSRNTLDGDMRLAGGEFSLAS